ncbi:MAG: GntR family transcriptional regulator, partial [Nocardioidaceae bacterium]
MDPLPETADLARAGVRIDPDSSLPPFEQLRSGLAARVADGTLTAGTRLPTVRRLADDLGLAVNTVARAYRELESDGVVLTSGRRGTFVASTALRDGDTAQAPARAAAQYAAVARPAGLTLPEAVRLLERA